MIWIDPQPVVRNVTKLCDGHSVFTFDFLTRAQSCQVLSVIERSDRWRPSRVATTGIGKTASKPAQRNQSQISVYADSTRDQLLFAEEFRVLREPVGSLLGLTPSALTWCQVAQYQRSVSGDFFHWHRDPSAQFPLKAIAICYLSDASSHNLAGGTTDFMLDEIVRTVTPVQGRCVVFDPRLMHRGALVTGGTKYAFTFGWM